MAPGCTNQARNYLGLRLRKPSTRAVWAPNIDAFLCREHAERGGKFSIEFEPGSSGTVEIEVDCAGNRIASRTTPIQRRAA
jgi:hypothetical protein